MFWTAHHTGKNQKLREEISISNPGPIVDDIETFEIKTPLDDGGFDFFKSDSLNDLHSLSEKKLNSDCDSAQFINVHVISNSKIVFFICVVTVSYNRSC